MFAKHDIEYEVNNLRAQAYVEKRQEGLVYCPAKDTPSTEALRLRQDLPSQLIAWLNRRDRKSGDLHGMLPLMSGMLVAFTEHINRSCETNNESSKDALGTFTRGYLLMMKEAYMKTMCESYINCRTSCS